MTPWWRLLYGDGGRKDLCLAVLVRTSLTNRGQIFVPYLRASNKIQLSTLLANAHSGKDLSVSVRASRDSQWC